ncbi:hypothetical protein [Thioalkalivibrio sp. ALgr3]|uniref:hypothetical protein n=1 Tax=Thioalkalivibrio sp. ALgr3 TaxID=1239292 RepID=UPI00035D2AE4|nr:hypothetical protein [Thioalkalivibrio sp. ALgr3]
MESTLPRQHTAGDSLSWRVEHPDYLPSDGWDAKAYLIGPAVKTVDGAADGAAWEFSAPASSQTDLEPGQYRVRIAWTKDGGDTRDTHDAGYLKVLADPAQVTDGRSHARRALEAIEATLEGKASNGMLDMRLNDRQVRSFSVEELLKLRDRYRAEVAAEDRAAGMGGGNRVTVRL